MTTLSDEDKVGLHVALTPNWSETAEFADYVRPMWHSAERHDTRSYETHAGRWLGFRQPVRRVAMEKLGQRATDTRDANPGEVWEENEYLNEISNSHPLWLHSRDAARHGVRTDDLVRLTTSIR